MTSGVSGMQIQWGNGSVFFAYLTITPVTVIVVQGDRFELSVPALLKWFMVHLHDGLSGSSASHALPPFF